MSSCRLESGGGAGKRRGVYAKRWGDCKWGKHPIVWAMQQSAHMTGLTETGGSVGGCNIPQMSIKSIWTGVKALVVRCAFAVVSCLAFLLGLFTCVRAFTVACITFALAFVSSVSAQITNPSLTAVSDTVGDAFNAGLALAVAAIIALLVLGYFVRAARRR